MSKGEAAPVLHHGLTRGSGVTDDRVVYSCGCELLEDNVGVMVFTPCADCATLDAEYLMYIEMSAHVLLSRFQEVVARTR